MLENTINIAFVTVPIIKVLRKHLLCRGRLGRFKRPENNVHSGLPLPKFFRKKGGVRRLFGVCVVKWSNSVYVLGTGCQAS